MATPASLFRPHGPARGDQAPRELPAEELLIGLIEPQPAVPPGGSAVEFEVRVPPSGQLSSRWSPASSRYR